jgi:hypothetical protein
MLLLKNNHRSMTEATVSTQSGIGTHIFSVLFLTLLLVTSSSSYGQAAATSTTPQAKTPPKTWIDAVTGHRVTRLTDEWNSWGLYFDTNAYQPVVE